MISTKASNRVICSYSRSWSRWVDEVSVFNSIKVYLLISLRKPRDCCAVLTKLYHQLELNRPFPFPFGILAVSPFGNNKVPTQWTLFRSYHLPDSSCQVSRKLPCGKSRRRLVSRHTTRGRSSCFPPHHPPASHRVSCHATHRSRQLKIRSGDKLHFVVVFRRHLFS